MPNARRRRCAPRSMQASRSSTRPTSMEKPEARNFSAARWDAAGTISCWPPNSACRWMNDGRGAKPDYVRQAVEDSLRRLGTDHIDLYQLHQPDPTTPIADTLGALDELVRAGKVREIGCSNFSASELRAAREVARPGAAQFVSVQNEYSLLQRDPERDVLDECRRAGLAFIPYFPLASGLLTGKYRHGQPPPQGSRLQSQFGTEPFTDANLLLVESLLDFATSRGHTLVELAVSWLASRQTVASIIAGATSPEQVKTNATAAGWRLTDTELAEIDAILSQPAQVSGS